MEMLAKELHAAVLDLVDEVLGDIINVGIAELAKRTPSFAEVAVECGVFLAIVKANKQELAKHTKLNDVAVEEIIEILLSISHGIDNGNESLITDCQVHLQEVKEILLKITDKVVTHS